MVFVRVVPRRPTPRGPVEGAGSMSGSADAHAAAAADPAQIGRISISDGTGIGFGHRFTHATASSMEGSSQNQ